MVLLGDEALVDAYFGPLGDSVNLMQDRCTVWAKRTAGSKIWNHLGDVGHMESHFHLFRDSVSVGAR
jgi:hypothetical protein